MFGPFLQRLRRPRGGLVGVAHVTGIGNFEGVSLRGTNESEGVTANVHIAQCLGNLRHVTGDTIAAGATRQMVGVLLNRRSTGSVRRRRAVAIQAKRTRGFPQKRCIRRSMRVMAGEAGHPVGIHLARDEIVALHSVLMGRAIGKVSEGRFPGLVFLKIPEIAEL